MGVRVRGMWCMVAVAVLLVAGCREDLVAPADGTCPDFCPPEQLQVVDSLLLDNVTSDSAFSGYVQPWGATQLQVYRDSTDAGEGGSRATLVFLPFSDSLLIGSSDTALGAVLGTDSFVVKLPVRGRNPAFTGLELALYRIPVATDSTIAFSDLDAFFTDSTLLAVVPIPDSLTSDTVGVVLDGQAFPTFAEDGNRVALGVALRSPAGYVQIGALDGADGTRLTRHVQVDSAGTAVPRVEGKLPSFDSFVASPLPAATADERDIGGTPATRTMLRFDLPHRIADSSAVLRATLVLVPAAPAFGAPGDSLTVVAQGLAADVGAKSPLQGVPIDSVLLRVAVIAVGAIDTVRLDVTDLVIGWTADTTRPRAFAIRALPEGSSVALLRIGAATASARPRLHITFVPPLTLGGR